jgi:hypothetical protein
MSPVTITFDVQLVKAELTPLQREKLRVAAQILKSTWQLYRDCEDEYKSSLRPLWAAGVITHGQPKSRKFVIGRTRAAAASTGPTVIDHLYRVTATAEYILTRAHALLEEEIEDILLRRSITMVTTPSENSHQLRNALANCEDKDNWQELYRVAGIAYTLGSPWVIRG